MGTKLRFRVDRIRNQKGALFLILLLLFPLTFLGASRQGDGPLVNRLFKEQLHAVQFYRVGWEFSYPMIELGSDQRLVLKFDDLSEETTNYFYTITHCDAEWYPSRLSTAEYLEGFLDNPINDFARSRNTLVTYTNYQLILPNEQVRFLVSGNYILSVYDEAHRDTPVMTRRFYVLEPLTDIQGFVRKSPDEGDRGRDQEIDFNLNYPRLPVQDPRTEIKPVVIQQARQDNQLKNLQPLFIRENQLSYALSRGQLFAGGNEFRSFDTKNLRVNGLGVKEIGVPNPYYPILLHPDGDRSREAYRQEGDLNGRFLIKNDRAADYDLESDYMMVKFTLQLQGPVATPVYVFGGLTDWECSKQNLMIWNNERKQYELTLVLKQGYYDYQYVTIEPGNSTLDATTFEGSHVETENDYTVLVYYRTFSSRYDRLVGFQLINSVKR